MLFDDLAFGLAVARSTPPIILRTPVLTFPVLPPDPAPFVPTPDPAPVPPPPSPVAAPIAPLVHLNQPAVTCVMAPCGYDPPPLDNTPIVTTPAGTVVSGGSAPAGTPVLTVEGGHLTVDAPSPQAARAASNLAVRQLLAERTLAPETPIPTAPAAVGEPSNLGTVAVLAAVGALWWFLKGRK